VRHSRDIIDSTQTLYSALQEVESDQRGYMLGGRPAAAEDVRRQLRAVPAALKTPGGRWSTTKPAQVAPRPTGWPRPPGKGSPISVLRVQL